MNSMLHSILHSTLQIPSDSQVAVVLGSISDFDTMKSCFITLKEFNIPFVAHILSAHRSHDALHQFLHQVESSPIKILIAAAGSAAHLAGVIASKTILPVIGVPLSGSPHNGLDALLSTVQMPGGIPVATMAVGSSGAKNAALLAIQILSLHDIVLRDLLIAYRKEQSEKVLQNDKELQEKLSHI